MRIIIADDHGVVLMGTKIIIKSAFPDASLTVVQSYSELLQSYEGNQFEILLLDINMPGTKNLAMISELKKINKNTKIIVFSSYDEEVALRYIKAGAEGYINKMADDSEIINAIKTVHEEGKYYSKRLMEVAMSQLLHVNNQKIPQEILSNKELLVFTKLLEGFSILEISNQLELHMSTVSTYKKRILEKLNLSNTTELIKMYFLNP